MEANTQDRSWPGAIALASVSTQRSSSTDYQRSSFLLDHRVRRSQKGAKATLSQAFLAR